MNNSVDVTCNIGVDEATTGSERRDGQELRAPPRGYVAPRPTNSSTELQITAHLPTT